MELLATSLKLGGAMPAPTVAPSMDLLRQRLEVREVGETCGYLEAYSDASIVCPGTQLCARNPFFDAYGCCDPPLSDCILPTSCVDYTATCDDSCLFDLQVTSCDIDYPYCATFLWGLDKVYTQLVCDSSAVVYDAFLTYSDEAAATTAAISVVTADPSTESSSSRVRTAGGSPPPAPTSTGPLEGAFPTSSPSATATAAPASSGLSTGAIAGIAVGAAIGGIGLIVLAVILFIVMRRRRRNNANGEGFQPPPPHLPPAGAGAGAVAYGGEKAIHSPVPQYKSPPQSEPTVVGDAKEYQGGFSPYPQQHVTEYDVAGNPVTVSPSMTHSVPSSPRTPMDWEKGFGSSSGGGGGGSGGVGGHQQPFRPSGPN